MTVTTLDVSNSFQAFVALDFKKSEGDDAPMLFGGFCSSEKKDRQGEILVQKGLNFAPFIDGGFFNDNHSRLLTRGAALGIPLDKNPVRWLNKGDANPLTGEAVDRSGHYVMGEFLDYEGGRTVYGIAKSLQDKSRSLGMSIEGKATKKHGSKVWTADVHHIAITQVPVSYDTSTDVGSVIEKALSAGGSVGAPETRAGEGFALREEDLDGTQKTTPTETDHGTSPVGSEIGGEAHAQQMGSEYDRREPYYGREQLDAEKGDGHRHPYYGDERDKLKAYADPEGAAAAMVPADDKKKKDAPVQKAQSDAPHYKQSPDYYRCDNCIFYKTHGKANGFCARFDFNAMAAFTCDAWGGYKTTHMRSSSTGEESGPQHEPPAPHSQHESAQYGGRGSTYPMVQKSEDGMISFDTAVAKVKRSLKGITARQAQMIAHRLFANYHSQGRTQ